MLLTRRGLLILLMGAPLLAAGMWVNWFEWVGLLLGVLAVLLCFLDWRLARDISRFSVERVHDTKFSLGADNKVKISVRVLSDGQVDFEVRDETPEAFQVSQRVLHGEAAPRRTWSGAYYLHPLNRGDFSFGNINMRWGGPLGLVQRQGKVLSGSTVKVYPNLLNVRRFDLLLRENRLQEMGLRRARMFGEGTEYERLRDYLPDDDYRRIDWKATARQHRPITTEFQTERSQTVIIMLDTGRMMQSPVEHMSKLDHVINAALLLAYVATGRGDKVGMMTFADEVVHYLSPRQGRGRFYRMLELLYSTPPQAVEPDYGRALQYLALKQRKRALVVLFTDLAGGLSMQNLTSHLSHIGRRSLPLVVTISDPDVLDISEQRPDSSVAAYERVVAGDLLYERQLALQTMKLQGVLTLDVPADRISMAVINQYLELKGKQLL